MSTQPDPFRWYHIGPHGFFDLVRMARRGRTTLVRVSYLLVLFAILYVVHQRSSEHLAIRDWRGGPVDRMQDSINHNARIAEQFSYTILIAQCVAVMLLTPIYVAASVHEDRDQRALGLLFSTQLTARAILQGKLFACVGHVGSVVFAGLPLLALVQLWGGIDMPMILANFWNTALWLFSVGAFSLMIATYMSSMFRAVAVTYALIACTMFCFCVPVRGAGEQFFLVRPDSDSPEGYEVMLIWLAAATAIHLFLAFFALHRAARDLDLLRTEEPAKIAQESQDLDGFSNRFWTLPAIGDDVIAWKERYLDRGFGHVLSLAMLPVLALPILVMFADWVDRMMLKGVGARSGPELVPLFKLVALASFILFLTLVCLSTTGCIVRERNQQTLDGLLLLPVGRSELLRSKIKGILLRHWPWSAIFGSYWLGFMLFGSARVSAGLALLFAAVVHTLFFALLGLFLSVYSRSMTVAYIRLTLILSFLFAGPWSINWLLNANDHQAAFLSPLSPANCWLEIANGWYFAIEDDANWWPWNYNKVGMTAFWLAFYITAGSVLWLMTLLRFDGETIPKL